MSTLTAASADSLLLAELPRLALFASAAQAEKYTDSVAYRLGVPHRAEASWESCESGGPASRKIRYENLHSHLSFTVLISGAGVIERQMRYRIAASIERTDARIILDTPPRLSPAKFEKDVRERLARLRGLRKA